MSVEDGQEHRANGATVAQLRHWIDQGHFRDKVAASDPSVTPLGTDGEAAGQPTRPEAVAAMSSQRTRYDPTPRRTVGIGRYWLTTAAILGTAVAVWFAL